MSKLKQEYDEVTEEREKIIEKIRQLEESEILKEYFELTKQNESLYNKQLSLYKDIKYEEYDSCEHILVDSKKDYDRWEGRTYRSKGCIKCGLDNSILDMDEKFLSPYGKIMYSYLRKKHLFGIETNIACDLELAKAIYSKIKQAHPDIDDETAIKYLENALNNIRGSKVSDDRKASRAKRLSLKPDFRNWNADDICDH